MNITIDSLVWRKMSAYIKHASGEISGLAKVERDENDRSNIKIIDIVLLEQVCTAANTELQADSLTKFAEDLLNKGEDMGSWRCWWHSHANMQTFWSNTDTNTIESLNPETQVDNFFVSIVGNKKNELLCRIDVFEPIRATLDKVDFVIEESPDEIELACMKEVEEKVVDRPTATQASLPSGNIETAGEILKKNIEDLSEDQIKIAEQSNFFTIREITGSDKKINYYAAPDGIYVLGKDGYLHKKLRNLSSKDKKRIKKAQEEYAKKFPDNGPSDDDYDDEDYKNMMKQYYSSNPLELEDDIMSGRLEESEIEELGDIVPPYLRGVNIDQETGLISGRYRRELYD